MPRFAPYLLHLLVGALMQIKWLEDFLSLVDTKAFSRAAEKRNVSQPTFSRHIQALEEWLGVELVDRTAQGVRLTPSGRVFRAFAAETLKRTYDMRGMLRGQQMAAADTTRFAVAHTLSLTYFPRWLKELKNQFGNISARVIALNVQEGATALAEGTCDLLIAYHHPQLPILLDKQRFPHLLLGFDRIRPFSAADHKGTPLVRIPGQTQTPTPFLAYETGAYFANVVESILLNAPAASHLERCFETHMSEALKAMVLEGHGLGWLPESCVGRETADGRLVSAGSEEWSTPLEIRLYRSAERSTPNVEKIWAHLQEKD